MPGALDGILVVTLEQAVAAPLASSRLADSGARVIKLERPEGDFARGYDDFVHGISSYFVWNNRGKESCTVDLKTEEDLTLVEAMLENADVFIQNLAPGATGRLGLGSADLRKRFPRLIVCDIGGFAPGTPDYDRKAYDLLLQAEAGLSSVTGSRTSGPSRVGVSICDIATGQAAYAAIVEALYRRERTGEGSHLQLSLFDTISEFMNVPYLARRYGGHEPKRLGLAHPSIAPYGVFSTRDGEILISIQNEREWRVLVEKVLDDEVLRTDERFASNTQRVRHRDETDERVQAGIANYALNDLCDLLDRERIAYGRVSDMQGLIQHRSVTTVDVATPVGKATIIAPPVLIDGKRAQPGAVPDRGEHTETLRREFASSESARRRRQ